MTRLLLVCLCVLTATCRDRPAPPPPSAPVASAPVASAPGPPSPLRWIVDGDGREWENADVPRTHDARGDADGPLDVVALAANVERARLLIRIDLATVANLYSGPWDGGTAVLRVATGDDELELDLRRRRLKRDGAGIRLGDAGLWVAPAHAAKLFELSFDLEALDWKPGTRVTVAFTAGDVVAPLDLTIPPRAPPRSEPVDLDKSDDLLRVASFNSLEHGILDADRAAAQRRLVEAVKPDLLLLQELGGVTAEQASRALGMDHGVSKNVDRIVGHAILSPHPMAELPGTSERFVAALVESPIPVVAVSVHLSCCGYLGHERDARRLEQGEMLARFVRQLRQGSIAGCPADVPVIVAGDFNDVGSPGLRSSVATASLQRIPLVHPRWGSAHTWGTLDAKYPASILDLMFASEDAGWRGGFILDTAELTEAELDSMGLRRADSASSDHRVLVADFRPR